MRRAQALIEAALLVPIGVLAVVVALNALLLVYTWTVVQDAARTGLVISMDSRMVSETCSQSCATATVRRQIRRVGAHIGLQDSDIRLGDAACNDGGFVAWEWEWTAWQPDQPYVVCVGHDFAVFGPFLPDQTFRLEGQMAGRRLP